MTELPPLDSTASDPRVLELLRALVRIERPAVCLEAGTYRGHAAVAIGEALRENGEGTLYTADPVDHGVLELLGALELDEWVAYRRTTAEELLESLPVGLDFAYIDHSGGTRARFFDLVRHGLRPGGLIVVDDLAEGQVWKDGQGGETRLWVREQCDIILEGARGLGIYRRGV